MIYALLQAVPLVKKTHLFQTNKVVMPPSCMALNSQTHMDSSLPLQNILAYAYLWKETRTTQHPAEKFDDSTCGTVTPTQVADKKCRSLQLSKSNVKLRGLLKATIRPRHPL